MAREGDARGERPPTERTQSHNQDVDIKSERHHTYGLTAFLSTQTREGGAPSRYLSMCDGNKLDCLTSKRKRTHQTHKDFPRSC
jgi:hypothetical protein